MFVLFFVLLDPKENGGSDSRENEGRYTKAFIMHL